MNLKAIMGRGRNSKDKCSHRHTYKFKGQLSEVPDLTILSYFAIIIILLIIVLNGYAAFHMYRFTYQGFKSAPKSYLATYKMEALINSDFEDSGDNVQTFCEALSAYLLGYDVVGFEPDLKAKIEEVFDFEYVGGFYKFYVDYDGSEYLEYESTPPLPVAPADTVSTTDYKVPVVLTNGEIAYLNFIIEGEEESVVIDVSS